MKIVVDWALCDGNGNCTVEAPEVFELDDDDQLRVLAERPGDEFRPTVLAAVYACPKRALSVED
jgi:ferredoxin